VLILVAHTALEILSRFDLQVEMSTYTKYRLLNCRISHSNERKTRETTGKSQYVQERALELAVAPTKFRGPKGQEPRKAMIY
jgi:hypothetical protein